MFTPSKYPAKAHTGRVVAFCLSVFTFALICILPQMNHSFYVADVGYYAIESQQAFHLYGRPCYLFWLTSYINGAWMALCPAEMMYYWFSLGGALLCALTYLVAGLIVREVYEVKLIPLFVALAVTALSQKHLLYDYSINYYTLPALFAEMGIWMYLKSRNALLRKHRVLFLLLSASFFALLPALRVSAICMAFIPIAYEILLFFIHKRIDWRTLGIYVISLCVGLSLVFLLYALWHSKFEEFLYAGDNVIGNHGIPYLLWLTFKGIAKCMVCCIPLTLFCLALRRFSASKFRWELLFILPLIGCALYFCWLHYYVASPYLGSTSRYFSAWISGFQNAIPLVLMVLAFIPARYGLRDDESSETPEEQRKEFRLRLLMLAGFALAYPLGSDCYATKLLYAYPVCCPLLLLLLRDRLSCAVSSYRVILVTAVLLGFAAQPVNIETPLTIKNRLAASAPYHVRTLAGMYEIPQKVAIHEKMIHAIQQYTQPQEEVLFLSSYFEVLTAAERRSWMHPMYIMPPFEESAIDVYAQHKPLPRVAVMTSGSRRVVHTWESKFLTEHYRKVYSSECAYALCGGEHSIDSEFSVWLRNDIEDNDTRAEH